MPVPPILVVAPPPSQAPKGTIAPNFEGAEMKSVGLAAALEEMAAENDCPFIDAGNFTSTRKVDGVHLDEDQHLALGKALAEKVREII